MRKKRATYFTVLTAGLMAMACMWPSVASGLTPQDAALYPWYNPEFKASKCGSGATTLVGNENEEKIYNYFRSKGMAAAGVAGLMGNMQAESGFNPRALQPGTEGDAPINGRGYGLSQWTYSSRQDPLIARAKAAGKPVYDLGVQLDYIWWELTEGGYTSVGSVLMKATDYKEATRIYLQQYEAPAAKDDPDVIQARQDMALDKLTKYGSSTISSSGTPGGFADYICGGQNGSGALVGNLSLPVAVSWYQKQPVWFTKPHHDYPAADIPVPAGTEVFAIAGGKITSAPMGTATTGYGLGVEIDAGNGVIFIYGHGTDGGSLPGAKEGDTVQAGQLIMHAGNTGHSFGAHLHLEIRVNGRAVCPQTFLDALGKGQTPPDVTSLPTSGCTN